MCACVRACVRAYVCVFAWRPILEAVGGHGRVYSHCDDLHPSPFLGLATNNATTAPYLLSKNILHFSASPARYAAMAAAAKMAERSRGSVADWIAFSNTSVTK